MTREELVRALREKARVLYEGNEVPHRSCGVALAETFARDPRPYLTLRRGGLTGEGLCGAVLAGQMVLGELLGGDDFTAAAPAALRDALARYRGAIAERLRTGDAASLVCNDLVRPFLIFQSDERAAFCTDIAATVAEIVAEILVDAGVEVDVTPVRR
jgi:hypothetical protein